MIPRNKAIVVALLLSIFCLTLLAGCGSSSSPNPPTPPVPPGPGPLSSANVNLIFVLSEDLAYQAAGDMNPLTANLTNRGLQRSLLMATFLKQQVLGAKNVTGIYALEPMTHLQTADDHPDIVALETVQQFAMLNQITLSSDLAGGHPYTGQNYPLNSSYGPHIPDGVVVPPQPCLNCQGLDFSDQGGDNENLVAGIIKAKAPGSYVFSAPWETTSSLLANINKAEGYNLAIPTSYGGPNYVYAISIAPSGTASLTTYNSNLSPLSSYPVLPGPPLVGVACNQIQPNFTITVVGGRGGAVVPAGTNINETVYIIRHAEAHPLDYWSDNNYVGAGQWRALDLPNALRRKIKPDQVYSMDPSQYSQGSVSSATGDSTWSTVAPSLTAEPYAIANNLPYGLVTGFLMSDPSAPQQTSAFFFNGGRFSNHTMLVAWAYQYIQPTVSALLAGYHANGQTVPAWPATDYDSIWTVTLDAYSNLTVKNSMCEGIDSTILPAMPPQF